MKYNPKQKNYRLHKTMLEERLKKRGNDSPTLIKQRIKRFPLELEYKEKFHYSYINKNIKETTLKIEKLIKEKIK